MSRSILPVKYDVIFHAEEIELEVVAQKDPLIKKAVLRLMELSEDERARMLLEKREMERMDNSVREKGASEQRAMQIAKAMIEADEPIEKIIKYTELTSNEIENLMDAN